MTSEALDPSVETGFTSVDDQPDPSVLVQGMLETAEWPAVRQLRAWERERLRLKSGDRLLDVGCGIGDVATALSAEVMPRGEVVGIDASEAMLGAARQFAGDAGASVTYRVGDATAIDEPDVSFDAVRSERMLQWLDDPDTAVGEMIRILRPGGRLSLIDTDWRSLAFDVDDEEASLALLDALRASRGPAAGVGGRLLNMCRDAALDDIEVTAAAHVWTRWDPDTDPAPGGLFPMRPAVLQLIDAGLLDSDLGHRFLDRIIELARTDRLCITLTMVAVAALRPA